MHKQNHVLAFSSKELTHKQIKRQRTLFCNGALACDHCLGDHIQASEWIGLERPRTVNTFNRTRDQRVVCLAAHHYQLSSISKNIAQVLDNSGNKSSGDRTLLSTVDADADDLWWIWVVWQWRLVKLLRPVAATIIGSGEPRFDGVFVDVSALCSHLVNRKWLASMSECCGPLLLMMMDTLTKSSNKKLVADDDDNNKNIR